MRQNQLTETCPIPSASNPFSCILLTNDNKCGCNENSIKSNVIFIIDNTGFINDYSWYYWSIEWIKLYQTKILINQPWIANNLTFIHIGNDTSNYIITPNIDINGDQINPNNIFNSWTIPDQYKNTNSPNFCRSIQTAMNIINTVNTDKNTVIIYLANSTPLYPNNDTLCNEYLGWNISNNNTSIYILQSSPNVNINYIKKEFSNNIKLEATMIDEYVPNITDNWGSICTLNSCQPNYDLVNEYMNGIISTSSDFICQESYLCDTIIYKSSNHSKKECKISCGSIDSSCMTNINSSKYYIINSLSGGVPLEMNHNEANNLCNRYFSTNLASLQNERDIGFIKTLMNDINVDECWIGINNTNRVFIDNDNTSYYKWIDGNINAFNKFNFSEEHSNLTSHCVSISESGQWYINECDEQIISCAICNVIDYPILTITDQRNYLIYTQSITTNWQQADHVCFQLFGTHLSTIQSEKDESSVINNAKQIGTAIQQTQIAQSLNYYEDDITIWNGMSIIISYDECIDFWTRHFDISYADGSHYNYTLLNIKDIIIQTCAPTAAPTNSPTRAPTNAPTYSPTRAPTFSPTASPSNAPTIAPTTSPTFSPTRSPTSPPTPRPTLSPTAPTAPTPASKFPPIDIKPPVNKLDFIPTVRKDFIIQMAPTITPSFPPPPDIITSPPTAAPKRLLQSPREPSKSPTHSPTYAPVYASDQCLALILSSKDINNSIIQTDIINEYEYEWVTLDCDTSYLSMFSCNKYDRASYQIDGTDYFVLMEEDNNGKTWTDANDYCLNVFGTSLATMYNEKDEMEVVDLRKELMDKIDDMSNSDNYDMWIGLIIDDAQITELEWSDKSQSDYSQLISGCLAIDNHNKSLWNIELCDGAVTKNLWACNSFVPTQSPTLSPTLITKIVQEQKNMFEEIADFVVSYPFEVIYIIVLLLSFIITIFAWIHAKSGTCCWGKCACLGFSDNAKFIAAFVFGLQLWDFLSDISFAYNLPNKTESTVFYLSVIFIIIPWSVNIVFLLSFRYKWANNREVGSWLREHTIKLVGMTMICGGAQPSIELVNSRIFGLDLFSMGLSRYQLIQSGKFKVMLTTVLENIPQIMITTYYMISIGTTNDFAIASIISSTCSVILVIVATILMRGDNLVDEPLEILLYYKFSSKNKKQRQKISRIGLHTTLAKNIANSIGMNENMVFVDKHTISLKTITLNISITHIKTKQEMEQEMESEINRDEDEEELISKTSTIYKLDSNDCKNIVDGILMITGLNKNELRISKMEIFPLDFNGGRNFVSKVTTFDYNNGLNETKWNFPDNPLFQSMQQHELLDTNFGAAKDENKTTDDDELKEEEEEALGLLIDSD